MLKLMLLVRRKPGTTREAFRDYYESIHAPLASGVMAGCKRYLRNFVIEEPGGSQDFDVITEFWFDLEGPFAKAAKRISTEATRAVLEADEARFMDRGSMRVVVVDERESDPAGLLGNV